MSERAVRNGLQVVSFFSSGCELRNGLIDIFHTLLEGILAGIGLVR